MYDLLYNFPMQVTAAYAKANLSELLNAVQRGETVEITRYNKPIAVLVSSSGNRQGHGPQLGTAPPSVRIIDPNWAKPMTTKQMKALIERGTY